MEPAAPMPDAAFCTQTYEDTLALLERTRDLIAAGTGRDALGDLPPEARMRVARDLSRLTSRASAAMSIMLLYKAIAEEDGGGIDRPARHLADLRAEIEGSGPAAMPGEPGLPPHIADLIADAEEVFARTAQVCRMLHAHLNRG